MSAEWTERVLALAKDDLPNATKVIEADIACAPVRAFAAYDPNMPGTPGVRYVAAGDTLYRLGDAALWPAVNRAFGTTPCDAKVYAQLFLFVAGPITERVAWRAIDVPPGVTFVAPAWETPGKRLRFLAVNGPQSTAAEYLVSIDAGGVTTGSSTAPR